MRLVILTMILSGLIFSCQTPKSVASGWNYAASSNNTSSSNMESVERKILYSAYLSLTVAQTDSTNHKLAKISKQYAGYIHELGTARTTIRVKSMYLDSALLDISLLGKVENKNIKGQDVTEDFLDFQIRLDNAIKARLRYLELLSKEENVAAALKVEKELERLNATIDLLKGKMNRIDHLSEFSTITVNLKQKKKPGILGYAGIGVYRSLKWLIIRN